VPNVMSQDKDPLELLCGTMDAKGLKGHFV
jgi:hypothetical protein